MPHADPTAALVLTLALLLVGGKLVAELAVRARQPAVLGELLFGVLLGNLAIPSLQAIKTNAFVDLLARLGVLLLLFEVGLESTVAQMRKVGWRSLFVALLGVAGPFLLGTLAARWLLPDHSGYLHLFLGATLTATSVGITARVLKDLDQGKTDAARTILGAAVIDDVLGLILLAVVTGMIGAADRGEALSLTTVAWTMIKPTIFLVGALVLGLLLAPRVFKLAMRLRTPDVLLTLGLGLCFLLAWLADRVGLAAIVGAFAAGLVLEDVHYQGFVDRGEHGLEDLVRPLRGFLSPIFFVLMGMQTDLASFAQPGVLGLAAVLTVMAIVGKLLAGLGAPRGTRLAVAIGMIPRGEVGLIFASIGVGLTIKGQRVVEPTTFAALVVMVIITTFVTPPLLKLALQPTRK